MKDCMLLCRSVFSYQPKISCLFTCERNTECEYVHREREGLVITVCMFVCVGRQGQQVGCGEGVLPDGDCRAN